MYLRTIDQIRNVEWSQSYLWDIHFHDLLGNLPFHFKEWFPATDVEEDLAKVESYTFEQYMNSYKVPLKTSPRELKITFVDDINHSISRWLEIWMNDEILNNRMEDNIFEPQFISTLTEIVKLVQLVRVSRALTVPGRASASGFLNQAGSLIPRAAGELLNSAIPVYIASYWIYPEGELTWVGSSESGLNTYSQNFVVAGTVHRNYFDYDRELGISLGPKTIYSNLAKLSRAALSEGPLGALKSVLPF